MRRAATISIGIRLGTLLFAAVGAAGCACCAPPHSAASSAVTGELPKMGHRNWIVIADSAYPWQSSGGIDTVVTGKDQLTVVKAVLDELDHSRHVTPNIFLDAELEYVAEADAPGVTQYRQDLAKLLGNRPRASLPHEQIISKLDEAGKTFRVLILKTNMTIPYTTVFLRLDCAYWNAEAEKRLRDVWDANADKRAGAPATTQSSK